MVANKGRNCTASSMAPISWDELGPGEGHEKNFRDVDRRGVPVPAHQPNLGHLGPPTAPLTKVDMHVFDLAPSIGVPRGLIS